MLIATFTPSGLQHVSDKFAASGTGLVGMQTGMWDAATAWRSPPMLWPAIWAKALSDLIIDRIGTLLPEEYRA